MAQERNSPGEVLIAEEFEGHGRIDQSLLEDQYPCRINRINRHRGIALFAKIRGCFLGLCGGGRMGTDPNTQPYTAASSGWLWISNINSIDRLSDCAII